MSLGCSDDERETRAAYHEAARAIVALRVGFHYEQVSIEPETRCVELPDGPVAELTIVTGLSATTPLPRQPAGTTAVDLQHLVCSMAGPAAMSIVVGDEENNDVAFSIVVAAREAVSVVAAALALGPETPDVEVGTTRLAIGVIRGALQQALELLNEQRLALDVIAGALKVRRRLTRDAVRSLVKSTRCDLEDVHAP